MKSIDQAWTMIFQQRKISWNQLVNDCYTCKTFVKSINSMKEVFLCIFSVKWKIFFHVIEKTREINITDFTKEFNFKLDTHSVEKYYKTRSRKKFREINSLVTSLVKTLISRKKCWFFAENRDRVLPHFSSLWQLDCLQYLIWRKSCK